MPLSFYRNGLKRNFWEQFLYIEYFIGMIRNKNVSSSDQQTTLFTAGDNSRQDHSYSTDFTNQQFLIIKMQELESILSTSISQNLVLKQTSSSLQAQLQHRLLSIERMDRNEEDNLHSQRQYQQQRQLDDIDTNQQNSFSFKNQVYNHLFNGRQYFSALPSPIKRKEQFSTEKYQKKTQKKITQIHQKHFVGYIQKQKSTNTQDGVFSMKSPRQFKKSHRKCPTTSFESIEDIWNQSSQQQKTTQRRYRPERNPLKENKMNRKDYPVI